MKISLQIVDENGFVYENLRGHFETTVIYHIEKNTELYCSF